MEASGEKSFFGIEIFFLHFWGCNVVRHFSVETDYLCNGGNSESLKKKSFSHTSHQKHNLFCTCVVSCGNTCTSEKRFASFGHYNNLMHLYVLVYMGRVCAVCYPFYSLAIDP